MARARWWRTLFGRGGTVPLDRDRTDLVVVAASFDDTESCSAALERGAATTPAWVAEDEAVLRHHLRLPARAVAGAAELAAQDGYTVAVRPVDAPEAAPGDELVALTLVRTQALDALHCAQEKSRMAGLAQRAGGTAVGWDALQPVGGDAG
ncbi:hypothetical protein ACFWPA_19050 [Rhodococcus sp. NPDC058505]|uniref:hypothetical protein n=1 Tax=unclassified Rhodococcus (in: high G+C Gram-positive bacteria) TaxID=192944 RepID=UPI003650B914